MLDLLHLSFSNFKIEKKKTQNGIITQSTQSSHWLILLFVLFLLLFLHTNTHTIANQPLQIFLLLLLLLHTNTRAATIVVVLARHYMQSYC